MKKLYGITPQKHTVWLDFMSTQIQVYQLEIICSLVNHVQI